MILDGAAGPKGNGANGDGVNGGGVNGSGVNGGGSPGGGGRAGAMVLAFRLSAAQLSGDLPRVLATAPQLLAETAHADAGAGEQARALALVALGGARLQLGEPDLAEPLLRDGLALAMEAGLDQVQLTALSQLAVLDATLGRLHAAERMARRALDLAAAAGRDAVDLVWARLALAYVGYEWDRLDDAAYHLNRALDSAGTARPAVLAGDDRDAGPAAAGDRSVGGGRGAAHRRPGRAGRGPGATAAGPLAGPGRGRCPGRAGRPRGGPAGWLARAARDQRAAPWAEVAGARVDLAEGRPAPAAAATAALSGPTGAGLRTAGRSAGRAAPARPARRC